MCQREMGAKVRLARVRSSSSFPKATVAMAGPFIVISAFLTAHIAYNQDWVATAAVTGGSLAGVLMYAAVFNWLGLVSKQAIGIGLAFIVLWEGFFSGFVSGVRLLSIRHYTAALINGFDPRRFVELEHVGLVQSLTVTAAVIGVFTVMAVRQLRRMDVP